MLISKTISMIAKTTQTITIIINIDTNMNNKKIIIIRKKREWETDHAKTTKK